MSKPKTVNHLAVDKALVHFTNALTQVPLVIPRVTSETRLRSLLSEILTSVKSEGGPALSVGDFLDYLRAIGLVHPIKTESSAKRTSPIYLLGINKADTAIDPIELLCAHDNQRVVCYFTALAYHGLTTQLPLHHHAASLKTYVPRAAVSDAAVALPARSSRPVRSYNPLGTKLFDYQGLAYYLTQRDKKLVPGIQRRDLGPTGIVRLTTLEQTLLDTLHKPVSCGGPAVVFEAWKTGMEALNEDRMARYLMAIGDDARTRRAGWMLERVGYTCGKAGQLEGLFRSVLDKRRDDPGLLLPLLPGLTYTGADDKWGLAVPG
jgi:hypothetical protein